MTTLLLATAAVALSGVVWILRLVSRDRLYVGYGVLFLLGCVAIAIAALPPFAQLLAALFDLSMRALAVLLWASLLLLALFVYMMTQMTLLGNRVAALVQDLAIRTSTPNRQP